MKNNITYTVTIFITLFSINMLYSMNQEQAEQTIQKQELVHRDLIKAIENNELFEIEALIASGTNIQYRDIDGKTVLHTAIKELKTDIIILLLKYSSILLYDDQSILPYAQEIAATERLISMQSTGNPARAIISRNIVTLLSRFKEWQNTHQQVKY